MSAADGPLRRVLITGATGAIGGALALEYAQPGTMLILQGRRTARLDELAAECRGHGALVLTKALDVRDRDALRAWLTELCASEPIDLLIACNGVNINIGADRAGEPWPDSESLIEVNLLATMATVDAVLPSMRRRQSGQIALLSSLAGYFGLPVTPSYCASKAGIKAYGEALRGWLAPEGIRVSVIMPGYVKSPMCDGMPGPKPFLRFPPAAARTIREGLTRDRARISFPFPLNLGSWLLAVLPAALSLRIVDWLGYRG